MREKRIVIDGIETNYIAREDGTIYNEKTGKDLKGTMTVEGYIVEFKLVSHLKMERESQKLF